MLRLKYGLNLWRFNCLTLSLKVVTFLSLGGFFTWS